MDTPTTTPMADAESRNLRRSLQLISVAGCLAMVYMTAIGSPATTEFFRTIGAREIHFGVLSGLPMALLSLQFVGALLANRLPRRKPLFMVLLIAGRLNYLCIAFIPILFPDLPTGLLMAIIVGALAVTSALHNMVTPLWLSWMGDLIPRRRINSYWGQRHVWMQGTWMACYLTIGATVFFHDIPIRTFFPLLVTIGVAAGVIDILLFLKVDEPPNHMIKGQPIFKILTAPLRHPEFRSFVRFNCYWSVCVMMTAMFMQLYVLKVLQLGVWRTTLIWSMYGFGATLVARGWGRLADRHGQRPILVLCVCCKPLIVTCMLLVTPAVALPVLLVAAGIDSMLNAGIAVAVNGYMLKIAPRENRSMFVASITGLAGLCGGTAAFLGGLMLDRTQGMEWQFLGRMWNNYQLLFAVGILLRLSALPMVRLIKEPASSRSGAVLHELRGIWPLRVLLFPVGLYRRVADSITDNHDEPPPC